MPKNGIFIAATGQHVGKTTTCLGILAALKKRYNKVGFIKPVGQQHVDIDDTIKVDKDVVLFKTHFDLSNDWVDMSPVIIPSGFTRQFLDGEISEESMLERVRHAYQTISEDNDFTLVEGTGHVGVGSIIGMNNAQIAAELGLDMVIIASGGLGSSLDELALNIAMCREYGVNIRGVILNKVISKKRDMILNYFPKALKKYKIPLLGCIPFLPFLSNPTVKDFEVLFKTPLLSGMEHRYRHYDSTRLVAGTIESYKNQIRNNELVITLASRDDIINAIYDKQEKHDLQTGMILAGRKAPSFETLERIRNGNIPVIYMPIQNYEAMKMISNYVAKIRTHDLPKVEQAIKLMEKHIDIGPLIPAIKPEVITASV